MIEFRYRSTLNFSNLFGSVQHPKIAAPPAFSAPRWGNDISSSFSSLATGNVIPSRKIIMTERNGVTNNDGDAVDNDSVNIETLPENRSGAIIDTKPAGGQVQVQVEDKDVIYCTISRWILRLKLWNKYLVNGS